ncbi:MAG: UDP-N-acetylmuramoyl-L-alanine--D-glutamate ligase [Candidatus Nomurabacteria bacterium]|jgi:UDP-N-acetylmuramoylalanine--D-glutamate ligase|nr:UDP-N-acetylmuramoyl-L-alanine--D-glutamate ligase [Candidatus Nomurabacteria bacterium]
MKIAILGYGVEGKSAYDYFLKQDPASEIDLFDEKVVSDDVVKITTVKSFSEVDFSSYDLIVRSPSVQPDKISVRPTHQNRLTSVTQIFFDNCPAPIIGVTGTKGKGTTASFIYEILTVNLPNKVHLLGNIGKPALDALPQIQPNDVVVYELSSFQLWDLTKSPHVAVITMFEPDHLEVHTDYQEYVGAKLNILRHQSADDFAIVNKNIDFGSFAVPAQTLFFPDDSLRSLAENRLVGEHNIANAEAAILAVRAFDPTITDSQIRLGLKSFYGLPHRLKFVAEKSGVKYYDDSIATTPGSAIAAVRSFTQPKILILGGSDKGADYHEIGEVAERSDVRQIFVIGANQAKVAAQVSEKFHGQITPLDSKNMAEIVKKIAASARAGEVVIMSPAAASFDMFENYQDRGRQFVEAVKAL